MSHGSLGYARMAVRQSLNTGEGFRETHGLLGKLKKLFTQLSSWLSRLAPKSFQKMLCVRAISTNPMPCKRLRRTPYRALPCAAVRPAPESHILPPASLPYMEHPSAPQTGNLGTPGAEFPPCPPARSAKAKLIETKENAIYGQNYALFEYSSMHKPSTTSCSLRIAAQHI